MQHQPAISRSIGILGLIAAKAADDALDNCNLAFSHLSVQLEEISPLLGISWIFRGHTLEGQGSPLSCSAACKSDQCPHARQLPGRHAVQHILQTKAGALIRM